MDYSGYGMAPTPPAAAQNRLWDKIKLRPVRDSKELLAADVNTLQNNPQALGLDAAQRQQMLSEATQASNAARQAQMTQLGQQALAGQPFQQNAFQQAQKSVAESGSQAQAQASSDINKLNQQMIESESNRIRSDLDAARQRAKENTQFWGQFGLDTVSTIVKTIGMI
jgi:hypothetical protein